MKPYPDVYQDERFSTPQFVYDKKQKVVAQISVDHNSCLWVRSVVGDDWGEWITKHKLFTNK